MEDNEKGVPAESPAAAPDSVNQAPVAAEGQTQQEAVSTEATPAQGQEQPKETQSDDTNWKNRAMEYERKLRETVEAIPQVIQEAVGNLKPAEQPKQPEYTIADLKAFVDTNDDPANKRWAYSEIERLESERLAKTVADLTRKEREVQEVQVRRQQAEQSVVSNPLYAEAFIDNGGVKQFNFEHPLTKMAHSYIKDPDLARRPDALAVAMKLAYADYSYQKMGGVQKKLDGVKVENTKLKQATLVEGGGVNAKVAKPDGIQQAKEELAKTGSKTALRTLSQAILRQQGLIQ